MGGYWTLEFGTIHTIFADTNYVKYDLFCRDIVPPNSSRELDLGNKTAWKQYHEKGFKILFSLHAPKNMEDTVVTGNMSSLGYFNAEQAIARTCDKKAIEELIDVYVDWMFNKSIFDTVKVKFPESSDTWIDLQRTDLQIIYIDYTGFYNSCVEVASRFAARLEEERRRPISGSDFWDYLNS